MTDLAIVLGWGLFALVSALWLLRCHWRRRALAAEADNRRLRQHLTTLHDRLAKTTDCTLWDQARHDPRAADRLADQLLADLDRIGERS